MLIGAGYARRVRSSSGNFALGPGSGLGGQLPEAIGRYRVQRELGRGAAGVVYAVTREGTAGVYALKLVRDVEGLDPAGLARFQREAQLSSRLDHPGVVGALDAGAHGNHRYLVLPLVEGESLAERLRREQRLAPREAAQLVLKVAQAMAYVHRAGVVHRDLKPDNILLDQARGGAPRVVDFGIAREGITRSSLTQSGVFLGTAAYMSPEQLHDASRVSGQADVYSLGVILYECLQGTPPFTGGTPLQIADQTLHATPPPLGREVPSAIAAACAQALLKDPEKRPDATQLARLLERALAAPASRGSSLQRPLLLGLGTLVLAVATGITTFALTRGPTSPAPPGEGVAGVEAPSASASASPSEALDPALFALACDELRRLSHRPRAYDPALARQLEDLLQAAPNEDSRGEAALLLGDYLTRLERSREALSALVRVPRGAKSARLADLYRAWIYSDLGETRRVRALEADLVYGDPTDLPGRVTRARASLVWERPEEARALLKPLLAGDGSGPLERHAVYLASSLVDPSSGLELLERTQHAADARLTVARGRALYAQDKLSEAEAAFAQARALTAPAPPAKLFLHEVEVQRARGDRAGALRAAEGAFAAEPNAGNAVTLLALGGGVARRNEILAQLQLETPAALQGLFRSGLSRELAIRPEQVAAAYHPSDASWEWARSRVAALPEPARGPAYRALAYAISGALVWTSIEEELRRAVAAAPDSEETSDLCAELCVRRGRVALAQEFLGGRAAPPRLRARLELCLGHENAAREAFAAAEAGGGDSGRLAALEAMIEEFQGESTSERLDALDPDVEVDVYLARARGALARFLISPEEEARCLRAAEALQERVGSLDLYLPLIHSLRARGAMERDYSAGRLRGPGAMGAHYEAILLHFYRATYYAGGPTVPATRYLRATYQAWSNRSGPPLFFSMVGLEGEDARLRGLLGGEPAPPVLDYYLALVSPNPTRARELIERAHARDPEVRLPQMLASFVRARYPIARPEALEELVARAMGKFPR